MTPKSVELLRVEAIRLIKLQIEKLNQLTQIPNLLIADSKDAQSYDPDKVRNAISILEGELSKLEELDMVLAVVGTMKAGKSTTNNAIVGLEVLPNRSTPMTALPSRIRHKKGQLEPHMQLPKVEPLNEALRVLTTQLARPEQYKKIENEERDLKSLADRIKVGMSFATEYQGQENIFTFLKELNDLVRLCQKLECEFPYADYQNIADLPMIKVAFCHLNEQASNQGHFTLLDTPGPNEMGMGVLKKMMREQLQRASAVMVVMDATQLKSESDHDVRSELLAIADVAEDRLYVLVNKFDQMDRSFDKAQIQRLISRDLLMGKVPESHVFPVSAKFAYLANRAQHALTHQGALPDHQQHDWVADFAKAAIHPHRWQNKINDIDEVKQGISDLWDESCFDAPLTEVIKKAHAKASLLALASSAAKMVEQSERMNNFVEIRDRALKDDIATLENNIKRIEQDVEKIQANHRQARLKVDALLIDLDASMDKVCKKANEALSGDIDKYFKEGKRPVEKDKKLSRKRELNVKNSLSGLVSTLLSSWLQGSEQSHAGREVDSSPNEKEQREYEVDFSPNEKEIVFDNHQDAKTLIGKIEGAVESMYKEVSNELAHAIDELKIHLEHESKELRVDAQKIIENITNDFSNEGIKLNLSLPTINPIPSNFTGSIMLNDMIEEKNQNKTGYRKKDTAWGRFCNWLNDDWGIEEYNYTKKVHRIDLVKIRTSVEKNAKDAFSDLHLNIQKDVVEPVKTSLEQFFDSFKEIVDNIRGDLIQGIKQSQMDQEQKAALALQLLEIKSDLPAIMLDSKELKLDLTDENGVKDKSSQFTTEGAC